MNQSAYDRIISGKSDNNILFSDFQNVIEGVGFEFKRQKGSHMVYSNPDISERMVVQKDGSKAKSYQVRQLRDIINKHGL